MADETEIPIQLALENSEEVLAKVIKFGTSTTSTMEDIEDATKKATAVLEDMVESMQKLAKSQEEYNAAVAAGKKDAVAPKTAEKSSRGKLPEGVQSTVISDTLGTALDQVKSKMSPEDFARISERINQKFTTPVAKDFLHLAEVGGSTFEKLGGSAERFMESFHGGGISSAIGGVKELGSALSLVAGTFGEAGAAAGAIGGVLGGIALTIVGVDVATVALADHASEAIIALDNMGKSAGVTAPEIYKLSQAFAEFGSNSGQLQMVIRNLNLRVLSDWAGLRRQVRDAADDIEQSYLRLSDLEANYAELKIQNSLADEKVRDASRAVASAARDVEEAKTAETRASLRKADAIDREIRAQFRLADAQRGVGEASRRQQEAGYALEEALKRQRLAYFAAADAAAKLKGATLSLNDAQNSYDSAKLQADILRYQKSRENGGPRDFEFEKSIPKRQKKIQEDAIFNREADAEAALKAAKENKLKAEIEASFPNREKERADIAVADAKDNQAKADEDLKTAQLDVAQAQRDVVQAQLAVADAQREMAAATDKLPAAMDRLTEQMGALAIAIANQKNGPNREREMELQIQDQKNRITDTKNADFKEILRALGATPEQRATDKTLINVADVDPQRLMQAIALKASPDGGTTPATSYQMIMEINKLFNENKDPALRTGVGKYLVGRGTNPQEIMNVLEKTPEQIAEVMDKVSKEILDALGPEGVAGARKYEIAKDAAGTATEGKMIRSGQYFTDSATSQLQAVPTMLDMLEGFIKSKLVMSSFTMPTLFNDAASTNKSAAEEFSSSVDQFSGAVNNIPSKGEPTNKAGGGLVLGPGNGTSDSIPANLSNGEYVVRSAAVSHWGVQAMDAINSMQKPGFAMGGLVGELPTPRFAGGGLVKSMDHHSLDIRTDAGSFTAVVSGDTMRAISKSAIGAKLKSSGSKPSWYGK